VSKVTKRHCAGTVQSQGFGRVWNAKQVGFWVATGRQLRKVQTWHDQGDCSRHVQRRPEKLGHRW